MIYNTLIVGAGSAGTGPLIFAARKNKLQEFLDLGVAILDKGTQMGSGCIGNYIVNSDTYTNVFLECLQGQEKGGILEKVVSSEITQALEKYRHTNAPLILVGKFLNEVGNALQTVIDSHPISKFFPQTEARSLQVLADGTINTDAITYLTDNLIIQQKFNSQNLVLALGAKQHQQNLTSDTIFANLNYSNYFLEKVLLSDFVLTQPGVDEMQKRLRNSSSKKVVIIGGSHSAFAAAWCLLNKVTEVSFCDGDIIILHRSRIKLCYNSRQEAFEDGYTDFTEEDICPTTHKVYRLGGLRTDSRELFIQVMGWSQEKQEKRINLVEIPLSSEKWKNLETYLDETSLIIYACGYDANIIPIYDSEGNEMELLCDSRGARIDDNGRVLLKDGSSLPNVLVTGLGAGFKYSEKLSGEKTFKGQINGVWIYQNTIGEIIFNQIFNTSRS
ncbi:MAG: hypothetical protein RMX96_15020 [Nostoc sp. ChiSLP02]|nr:hypothetical protein [Nostoc sp. DedSLP05]MDZ8101905.1 hypothetical protein [Nostoc sp. DedSLP01]MDZ8186152.1 hypothetical protein [Nostoc sp. ChiSLP02]